MKIQQYKKRLLFIAVLVAVSVARAVAQEEVVESIPTQGTWNAMKITSNQTVELKGDITVDGRVTITNDAEVTLVNNTGTPITIKNKNAGAIFGLRYGSSLTIQGKKDSEIIIDGGADFTWEGTFDDGETMLTQGKLIQGLEKSGTQPSTASMIETNGNLTLEHVIIRNYYTTWKKEGDNSSPQSAIFVAPVEERCGTTTLTDCRIENCMAPFGAALYCHTYQQVEGNTTKSCAITFTNTTVTHCVSTLELKENGEKENDWTGAIRFRGSCKGDFTLTNCTFTENYTKGTASCLIWNSGGKSIEERGPLLTMENCMFTKNRADIDGGAVRLEGTFTFTGEPTQFTHNNSGKNGGAIQIKDYSAGENVFTSNECIYNLPEQLVVENNEAEADGGGISFEFSEEKMPEKSKFSIYLGGMKVENNKAGGDGGGMCFEVDDEKKKKKNYEYNVYLSKGTVNNNTAGQSGGGIYMDNIVVEGISEGNDALEVKDNKALNGNGGGFYLQAGAITLKTAHIENNQAKGSDINGVNLIGRGGGIYIYDGNLVVQGTATINGNTSESYGGGIYVNNTDNREHSEDDPINHEVKLSGGSINNNHGGHAGGGICFYGHVDATINGVSIQNNDALNAGGILLKGYKMDPQSRDEAKAPKLTFSSGLITDNKATGEGDLNTGYNLSVEKLYGVGGGIVVGTYASMHFDLSDAGSATGVGIYRNTANKAADDIFCSGVRGGIGGQLDLPDVSKMKLDDFADAKIYTLYWVEDYFTNDPNYDKGTKKKGDAWESGKTNQRYRYARDYGGEIYAITGDDVDEAPYVCATLGWYSDYIILEKEGLEDRDNAIFEVFQGDNTEGEKYMTVILTADDKDPAYNNWRRKAILVPAGTWTINENTWSWAYEVSVKGEGGSTEQKNTLTKQIGLTTDEEGRTFHFMNTPKKDTPNHAEDVKVNKLPSESNEK